MSNNVFTLESLEEEIERDFSPLTFTAGNDEFVLRNPLRLEADNRKKVMASLQTLEDARQTATTKGGTDAQVDGDEMLETVQAILKAVTADKKGDKLVKILGNDLVRCMKVMERWMEATQPGEASDSPS